MSVKLLVRQVGIPHVGLGVISAQELEEYIDKQFKGYELQQSHYLGEVKDETGGVQGYKFAFVFAKSPEVVLEVVGEAPKKRGRPVKDES